MSFGSIVADKEKETVLSLFTLIFEKIASLMRPSVENALDAAARALKLLAVPVPSIFGDPTSLRER